MYKHHQESINNLIDYFKNDKEIIAIILGGSVAKECARPDSDIDAIVVVTEEKYSQLEKANNLSECLIGHCTYENGYFDIKYCTEGYLKAVKEYGSEPSRNAFGPSRCLYSNNAEIETWVKKIPVFQIKEKEEKLLTFYSALSLNSDYFWGASKNDNYLKMRTATDIVLFGFRLLLQEYEVLFPCHKSLIQTVSNLRNKPEDIVIKANTFLSTLSDASKNDFVHSIINFIKYKPPQNYAEILTRYIYDNELWWYKDRPVIAEW